MSTEVSAGLLIGPRPATALPEHPAGTTDRPVAALGYVGPVRRAGTPNWRAIRRVMAVGYGVVLFVFVLTEGVPTERLGLYVWLLAGLSIGCMGRGWRSALRLVLDWLPFVAILVLYDLTRGLADTLGMPLHMRDLAALESTVFGGTLPTVWLQSHVYPVVGDGAWWHLLVTAVYVSHFLVTPVIAAVLWLRDRQRWMRFTAHVIGIALLGVSTYILVPAAPPWYAAGQGVIPEVHRLAGVGWDVVGLHSAGALLDQGQANVNLVAALPSLHTAYAVLVLLFFWPVLNRIGRLTLTLYPLLMGLILVYSGEHYVVDVALGWVCAGLVVSGLALATSRWQRRKERSSTPLPAFTAAGQPGADRPGSG